MLTAIMMMCTLIIWFVLAELIYPTLADWSSRLQQASADVANLKVKELIGLLMVALAAMVFAVPVYVIESSRR